MRFIVLLFCITSFSCRDIRSVDCSTQIDSVEVSNGFVDTLRSYLGTREETGNNDGQNVERFLNATCQLDNAAWCAAYLSYCLQVNGHQTPNAPCWTPSFFVDARTIWKSGQERTFEPGDIFGIYFKSKGIVSHVGAVVEDFGDGWILSIEGNTNSAGSREGDGVYMRLRNKNQIYVVSDWQD